MTTKTKEEIEKIRAGGKKLAAVLDILKNKEKRSEDWHLNFGVGFTC